MKAERLEIDSRDCYIVCQTDSMTPRISRRDFLKVSGLAQLGLASPGLARRLAGLRALNPGAKNIIVLVFDALSATNVDLYGYGRATMPNLERLAERAIVYHAHYAGSNFTSSGVASLLTGTLPWTNRALGANSTVLPRWARRSLFSAFPDFYRIAYTHNSWAYTLLRQFGHDIDELVPPGNLFLPSSASIMDGLFRNDEDLASVGLARILDIRRGDAYSLLLSHLHEAQQERVLSELGPSFPRGIPSTSFETTNYFVLERAVDWLSSRLPAIPKPFLGYFHFLPPHSPYRTSVEFYQRFATDGFRTPQKPIDVFAEKGASEALGQVRKKYDEYVLYADKGLGAIYDFLQSSGLLEDTWVVVTSDHGEMLERGMVGHGEPSLYQPIVRVPLVILEPGREERLDIHTSSSAVDILPTLFQLTGRNIPEWTEGRVLPPFATVEPESERAVYAAVARKNDDVAPLTHASTMLIRGRHKLLYYFGYPAYGIDELVKLYDVQSDPEELVDLYSLRRDVADELLRELQATLRAVNHPFL